MKLLGIIVLSLCLAGVIPAWADSTHECQGNSCNTTTTDGGSTNNITNTNTNKAEGGDATSSSKSGAKAGATAGSSSSSSGVGVGFGGEGGQGGAGGAGGSASSSSVATNGDQTNTQTVIQTREFLGLPGFVGITGAQPFEPKGYAAEPSVLPGKVSFSQCDAAKNSDDLTWRKGSVKRDTSTEMILVYAPQLRAESLASFVGTAIAKGGETHGFLNVLCDAALKAMKNGAKVGVVRFAFKPKTVMQGIGFGSSGGTSGFANPTMAAVGALGFGTGRTTARVDGEFTIHLTGFGE